MDGPIVVGTDGSDTASAAVQEAIELAKAMAKPLHIVSAYKAVSASAHGLPAEFQHALAPSGDVEAILEAAAGRARSQGVKVETHARSDDPASALLDVADEVRAGLLVIGNKGIGSAKRFVLGNVPSKVVHHSPCSTYVVHTA